MNQNVCYNCGGEWKSIGGRLVCQNCGTHMPERISNEEVTLLYTAFQKLRLADFYEAEREFDDIIRRHPRNAQAYWGRLMSHYGIKYEKDYAGKCIPTCYATSIDSIVESVDYRKALEYADAKNRELFQKDAKYLESIRREWLDKAQREKPYDIFISFKDSDEEEAKEGRKHTKDSDELRELYVYLMKKGYRVFFSRESLEGKGGQKYEPYIFGALSTAKVMLLYGSNPDYINATWVKNEWTRYQKRIRAGEKHPDSLIVAYKDFSPKDLPLELSAAHRQHLDASKPSFYNEVLEIIERIIAESEKTSEYHSHGTDHFSPTHFTDENNIAAALESGNRNSIKESRKNGPAMISKIGLKCSNDSSETWPNSPYTLNVDIDKYSVARFHIELFKGFSNPGTRSVGFQVYDSDDNLIFNHITEFFFDTGYDRFSTGWIVKPENGIPVAPGSYTAIVWIENSRVSEFHFKLISHESGDTNPVVPSNMGSENIQPSGTPSAFRNISSKSRTSKNSDGESNSQVPYSKLAKMGIWYLILSYAALLLLASVSTTTLGPIVTVAVAIIWIITFNRFYKLTKKHIISKKFIAFLLILVLGIYYEIYLVIMSITHRNKS